MILTFKLVQDMVVLNVCARHGYEARGYEAKQKLWSNHEAEAKAEALTFWKHKAEAEDLAFSKHEAEAECEAQVLPSYYMVEFWICEVTKPKLKPKLFPNHEAEAKPLTFWNHKAEAKAVAANALALGSRSWIKQLRTHVWCVPMLGPTVQNAKRKQTLT